MNKRVTQDDIIYFIVTDRFFGRNKRTVDASDTTIHLGGHAHVWEICRPMRGQGDESSTRHGRKPFGLRGTGRA